MDAMVWLIILITTLGFINLYSKTNAKQRRRRDRELLEPVSQLHRGTWAERDLVLKLIESGISPKAIFHDLYLKNFQSNYSQIDLVIATKVGLIVIEVKDFGGWIFGNSHQHNWTQVLAYGRERYRFYNPLRQNSKHISDIRKKLFKEDIPYFSIVVFYGNCVLKNINSNAENTYVLKQNEVLDVIKEIIKNNPPANYVDKLGIINVLDEAVKNGDDPSIKAKHVENIKNMLKKYRI